MPDKKPNVSGMYLRCGKCAGTGEAGGEGGQETCFDCKGDGYKEVFQIDSPINVFPSYLILEELDPTEHDALTDTQKEGINILLSCGLVNLNVGKAGRVRLWNWFGAESTTVANLTALLV